MAERSRRYTIQEVEGAIADALHTHGLLRLAAATRHGDYQALFDEAAAQGCEIVTAADVTPGIVYVVYPDRPARGLVEEEAALRGRLPSGQPYLELDFGKALCARHVHPYLNTEGEVGEGFTSFAMWVLWRALEDERIIEAAGGQTENLTVTLQEFSPLCCHLGDSVIGDIYSRVAVGEPPPNSPNHPEWQADRARLLAEEGLIEVTGDDAAVCARCGSRETLATIAAHLVSRHGLDPDEIRGAQILADPDDDPGPQPGDNTVLGT